jgi:hypothetical protein
MKHGSWKVVGDMVAIRGNKDGTSASCKTIKINQRSYCCPIKVTGYGKMAWMQNALEYI